MSSVQPEHFARVAGRVNLPLLATRKAVIVGVGSVGSPIARELAFAGVGRLCVVDGDSLEVPNLARHALPREYVGWNKAEGMAHFLHRAVPTLNVEFLARYVDASLSDSRVDDLFADADVVIAATDNRETQRRVGRRVLALDTPGVFPALYGEGGGEVFVSFGPETACFTCWDAFRTGNTDLRNVSALNVEILSLISLAVHLTLGVLDPQSPFARHLAGTAADRRVRNLFVLNQFAPLQYAVVNPRPGCASCAVGPSTRRPTPAVTPQATPPRRVTRVRRAAPRARRQGVRRLALLGGFGLVVASFLDWTRSTGFRAYDVPFDRLLQLEGFESDLTIGVAVLGLGALGTFLALFGIVVPIRRLLGIAAIAIAVTFAWRYHEWAGNTWTLEEPDDVYQTIKVLKDDLGLGVYFTFVSGLFMVRR